MLLAGLRMATMPAGRRCSRGWRLLGDPVGETAAEAQEARGVVGTEDDVCTHLVGHSRYYDELAFGDGHAIFRRHDQFFVVHRVLTDHVEAEPAVLNADGDVGVRVRVLPGNTLHLVIRQFDWFWPLTL